MKCEIDQNEVWPVYSIGSKEGEDTFDDRYTGEFTPEELARINAAEAEWYACQELIRSREPPPLTDEEYTKLHPPKPLGPHEMLVTITREDLINDSFKNANWC
jgi:hypothetical protein